MFNLNPEPGKNYCWGTCHPISDVLCINSQLVLCNNIFRSIFRK